MQLGLVRKRSRGTRLFYASDVHGSGVCWRKFLNARAFYEVDALVMGGDLTGKALVPIVEGDGGVHCATVSGDLRRAAAGRELDALEADIRARGFYPWLTDSAGLEAMRSDPVARERIFEQVIVDELARWVSLSAERLGADASSVYVMPGNDDPWAVDAVLESSPGVVACDDAVVQVGPHEMVSLGWSNPTPWNSPRELSEDDLYTRVRRLTDQLASPATAILNLHVPPHASGLDNAVQLDEELRPVMRGGQPQEIPVGSTAVRQVIEEVQPALALHGHIHEGRGVARIGRTLAINPGSDYGGGRIEGCVVELGPEGVCNHHLTTG